MDNAFTLLENQSELNKNLSKSIDIERYNEKDKKIFYPEEYYYEFGKSEDEYVEVHVYDELLNYINSNYRINTYTIHYAVEKILNKQGYEIITETDNIPTIKFNPEKDLYNLNIQNGKFKLVYNFFKFILGNEKEDDYFISEISSDRTEIRLACLSNDETKQKDFLEFGLINDTNLKSNSNLLLNFKKNYVIPIVNWELDKYNTPDYPYSIVFKLYKPLPEEIEEKSFCFVVQELVKSKLISVEIEIKTPTEIYQSLKPPNFNLNFDVSLSNQSDYLNEEKILNKDDQQYEELNALLKNPNFFENVNLDYENFSSFIFYGSAEKIIENLIYKVSLIEHYEKKINESSFLQEKLTYKKKKEEIIQNFTAFERYSYFSPSPNYTINDTVFGNVLPKDSNNKIYSTNHPIFINWARNRKESAIIYDIQNDNQLRKYLPLHYVENTENSDFLHFVDMLGEHFDILYLNINALGNLYNFQHKLNEGISKELAFFVAKSLGINLIEGYDFVDLVDYLLGRKQNNKKLKPYSDISREIWKRLLNNFTAILKAKGTARGIQILLNCFGIPAKILKIREFDTLVHDLGQDRYYINDNVQYYLNLNGQQSIRVPWESFLYTTGSYAKPSTIEFRFRLKSNERQILVERPNNFAIIVENYNLQSKPFLGRATLIFQNPLGIISSSIENIPIYNKQFWSVMLSTDRVPFDGTLGLPTKYTLTFAQYNFNEIVFYKTTTLFVTGSNITDGYNVPYIYGNDYLYFGGSNNNNYSALNLKGNIHEIRFWKNPLDEKSFKNHVRAPNAYNSAYEISTFDNLILRYNLSTPVNYSQNPVIKNIAPNKLNYNAQAIGFPVSNYKYFDYEILKNQYLVPRIGVSTYITHNVVYEKTEVFKQYQRLHYYLRSRKFVLDDNHILKPKIGVYFSPVDAVNEDIIASMGDFSMDDYIGEPNDYFKSKYPLLEDLREKYYRKNTKVFASWFVYLKTLYFYDKNLFNLIKEYLPARTVNIVGLLVEPSFLERNKIERLPIKAFGTNYKTEISKQNTDIEFLYQDLFSKITQQNPQLKLDYNEFKSIVENNLFKLKIDDPLELKTEIERIKAKLNSQNFTYFADLQTLLNRITYSANYFDINSKIDFKDLFFLIFDKIFKIDDNRYLILYSKDIHLITEQLYQLFTLIEYKNEKIPHQVFLQSYGNELLDVFNFEENFIKVFFNEKECYKENILKSNIYRWYNYADCIKLNKNDKYIDGENILKRVVIDNSISISNRNLYFLGCKQIGDQNTPKSEWTTPDGLPLISEKITLSNRFRVEKRDLEGGFGITI